ncbi:MAG: hypothetical protein ACP5NV_01025 [Candidatus Woesearchaeota archaeon]
MFKFEGEGPHDILVAKVEVENEETFHLKNLYKLIHDWLAEEGFKDIYGSDDNPEIFYLEKILGSGAKEHRIWWRCYRIPAKSKYYRYFLKINFLTINMKSIEVMHQGHKMKTDRGDLIVTVEAYLQIDYNKEWRKNNLMMKFDKLFRNRIYKAQIESYKVDLYKTTYRLQNVIKQYLKLKTLYEMPKPFYPEKGL